MHVDELLPGDRNSKCRALMAPTGIVRKSKGFQIIHTCTKCGKQRPNIVAFSTVQDDLEALLVFMRESSLNY